MSLVDICFQQEGTTCHTAHATMTLIKNKFDEQVISNFGPVNWPPTSYNVTPVNYVPWRYVKTLFNAEIDYCAGN